MLDLHLFFNEENTNYTTICTKKTENQIGQCCVSYYYNIISHSLTECTHWAG